MPCSTAIVRINVILLIAIHRLVVNFDVRQFAYIHRLSSQFWHFAFLRKECVNPAGETPFALMTPEHHVHVGSPVPCTLVDYAQASNFLMLSCDEEKTRPSPQPEH